MQTTIDIPTLPSSQDVEYETSAAPTRQKRPSVGGPTSPTGCKRAALNEITNQESESQVSLKAVLAQPSSSPHHQHFQSAFTGHATHTVTPTSTTLSYVDIDAHDGDDISAASSYANLIFHHLTQSELRRRPLVTYMDSVQTDINPIMRSILVDWLIEVGQEYRLSSETLFLSAAYLDRFLSLVDVKRNRLQLIGVSCMLIASKYEEIYAPQIEEFCYITDNTYTREQVLTCEKQVLDTLGFDLTQPTIKTFLRRFIKAAAGEVPLDLTFEFLASYLAELCLMDYGMVNYLPSHIAASCVLVALWELGKPCWSQTLSFYSGYTPAELQHCAQAVHSLFKLSKTSKELPAAKEKYGSGKFCKVSTMACSAELPGYIFNPAA